jgi:hypothetical protein
VSSITRSFNGHVGYARNMMEMTAILPHPKVVDRCRH